jgi:hypothetical protein
MGDKLGDDKPGDGTLSIHARSRKRPVTGFSALSQCQSVPPWSGVAAETEADLDDIWFSSPEKRLRRDGKTLADTSPLLLHAIFFLGLFRPRTSSEAQGTAECRI